MSHQSKILSGKSRGAGIICLCLGLLGGAVAAAWGGSAGVEVRRVGISRVEDNTMLTVVLSRAAEPRVSTRTEGGKPQLVVEFPQARAGRLPASMAGDDLLVEQVVTESSPAGVKIVLELFPEQPYKFWRQARKGAAGQALFILGLTPDPTAAQVRQPPAPEPQETPETSGYREPEPPPPAPEDYGFKEERGMAATGSFAELQRLIPRARPLLQGLEREGWVVSESHTYDRPGQRFSRDYTITNRQYPEMAVKIVNLPANNPTVPSINIVTLTTDNLGGETANQYRGLRQWTFSQIRQKYEDIGDFFDDALKPLRVKLRQETQNLALRHSKVFQTFLQQACPENPHLYQKFMENVKKKVSPRFEGVQYTLSENPLVILNLVDFLYLKVFFLQTG
ncbi:MAG: hypothetical protein AB1424_00690 [Thermodesulfobacteriota bacterium]